MEVKEFLDEVRKLVLRFALGPLRGFEDLQGQTDEAVALDAVTQYYLLHRKTFAFDPVLAGVCILYANACGKTDRELQMVWNMMEQGGKKKTRRRGDAEEEEEAGEILNSSAKADKYRLVRWNERVKDDKLGENRPNHPAPLIDRLQRSDVPPEAKPGRRCPIVIRILGAGRRSGISSSAPGST